jgi:hypothetical protein
MEQWAADKKKLYTNVVVPPAPILVPTLWPRSLSVMLVPLLANDKGDNEVKPGLCTNILTFALWPRKTLENRS